MIKIISTIRRIDKCYNFMDRIQVINQNNIHILRFNVSKNQNVNHLENDIVLIRNRYPEMKIMLDLPYPHGKTRLILDKIYQVKKDDIYCIHHRIPSMSDSIPYICVNQHIKELRVGMNVIYDGGEGLFTVIMARHDGGYLLQANGDFIMVDGKSIWYGELTENECDFTYINKICPDYVALSFVQNAEEVKNIRSKIAINTLIIAKIETKEGIDNLEEIMDVSDGVMIARGDLGLCVPLDQLCLSEQMIARSANIRNKECYIATDILNSYIKSFVPSRADISDLNFIKELNVNGLVLNLQLSTSDKLSDAVELIQKVID